MRKVLFSFFLLFHVFVFSQTNPLASDISTAHFKDTDGSIHLVGSDSEFGTLTYTIVTLPSHGTIQDPLNSDAVIAAGGSLTGDVLTFVPHSDENHKYIFSGTTSFTYKVVDSGGLESATKTVTVKVFDSYLSPPTLIGAEINGDVAEDGFGRSVSLSEDGTIMAVGAPFNDADTADSDKGHVKVFKFNGTAWGQIGSDLDGITSQDYFGSSVSLSADGTILAVGIPYNDDAGSSNAGQVKTFLYDSGSSTWNLTGTITPNITASGSNKAVSEQFGNDVRLSSDGKTLAVSDIWFDRTGGNNQGRVVVYRYDGTNWNSLGNETALYGSSSDNFSWGISLSANGNIMAVGAHENDTPKNNSGEVKIYEYNSGTSSWDVKATLNGVETFDKFGASVDLSSDGLTVAVGAPYHRVSGSGTEFVGKVSVFKWNGTNYAALGSDLIGSDKYDYFGAHLSLDNEGNTLSVMGPGHDANSGSTYLNKGRVRVYNYEASSTSWVQSPASYDFDGEADGDQSASGNAESKGQRVFLSGDGSVLAIGADKNDGNGTDSGHLRVYKLFEVQQIPVANSQSVSFTLYEQVTSSEEIVLTGTDGDSGPNPLVYIITELNTAKLYEGGTEISSGDIPYTLTANKVKYNSNSDVVVNDSFKFIVHDGKASSVPATVSLTIIPDNDPPVATDQSVTSDEDVAKDITLAGTDVDTAVVNLSYLIYSLPANGTLTDKNNSDAAVSLVDRDSGTTDSASTNKLVDSSQDFSSTVQAGDFIINTTDNTYADVKAVDNNTTLSISADIMASGETYVIKRGTTLVVVSGNTKVTYTPNSNFAGSDSFKFKARDKGVNDDSATDVENSIVAATVSITINNTDNDPPVAEDQSITISEDTESGTITLVAADPDPDDTTLTYTIASLPSNGKLKDGGTVITAIGDLTGVLTYLPNTDYIGNDTFKFTAKDDESTPAVSNQATVTITITNANDPPLATAQSVTTEEDTAKEITHAGTDIDGDALTYILVTLPTNGSLKDAGTVIVSGDLPKTLSSANATYTPNANYNGADSYTFKVNDGNADSTLAATVSITISSVNDPPLANAQSVTTDEDTAKDITLTGSDLEGDTISFIVVSLPANGSLKDAGTVIASGDLPKSLSSAAVTYTPNNNYTGSDSFTFKTNDSTLDSSLAATVSINITEFNDPPTADDQSVAAVEQTAKNITLTGDDAETDPLTYIVSTLPTQGNLKDGSTIIASGDLPKTLSGSTLIYTGTSDTPTTDSFKFKTQDAGSKQSSDATVSITFTALNDPPAADDQSLITKENIALDVTLTGSDPDGGFDSSASSSYIITTLPTNGTLKHSGNEIVSGDLPKTLSSSSITYTPQADYNGVDSFKFKVSDGTLESAEATIDITITEVNSPPIANDQTLKTDEDTPLKIKLTGSDPEDDPLTYLIKTLPTNGILKEGANTILASELPKLLPADSLTYVPNANFVGDDSFDFIINANFLNSFTKANGLKYIAQDGVPVTYQKPEGKTYFLIQENTGVAGNNPIDWTDARDLTNSIDGATMYIVLNADMEKMVWDGLRSMNLDRDGSDAIYFWLGLFHDNTSKDYIEPGNIDQDWGGWTWTNGVTLKDSGYQNWWGQANGTEPNDWPSKFSNDGEEDYGQFAFSSSGDKGSMWNDMSLGANAAKSWPVFEFAINDSTDSNIATISIEVESVNDPPIAEDQNLITQEDVPLDITLKATDPEGILDMAYVIKSLPTNGNLINDTTVITADDLPKTLLANTLKYQPNVDYNGNEFFTFYAKDKNCINPISSNPCEQSNVANISIIVEPVNDPPESDPQTVNTDQELPVDITHVGRDKDLVNINLTYIITTYPSNGILKEGSTTITPAELPFTLKGTDATYVPNSGFYGQDKYNFKLNDGKADSTDKVSGLREDSQVTINIKEFVLVLPNNYTITPTETCKGSDFGILDIEVAATSYKKTASGPDIPITYKISIEGIGELATIVSPNKTAKITGLPAGKHKVIFKVVQEPKYEEIIEVEIIASDPPVAYAVPKLEVCDDAVDKDDSNGKVNFDTSTILNTLLKNPSTGVVQDEKLYDIEFTYFDDTTSANITKATLPNPLYSASQTVSVKFISKINGSCVGTQTIDFQVNTVPVFDRIEDIKSVCSNLDPVTIGVASKDSRTYSYTWTRNGTAFAPNIAGIDSSILIGLGGEYIVTATTTDGTNCSKTMTIQMKESSIAALEKKDIVIKELKAGPNNSIEILTATLGIGDYEYAIDDITGPYQDEPIFEKVRPGSHTVYVRDKNDCGIAKMPLFVIGYKKFFTPNGDGYTDKWNLIGITKDNLPKTKIYIFDRFEKLIKELDPLSEGWDGNFIGKPMPQTDYWFKVILEDGREFKGHFSLLRAW